MLKLASIFIGGGLGAILRYLCTILCTIFCKNFPLGTLVVNISGCFLMGFLFILFLNKFNPSDNLRLFLTTGLLGGLTTFSTFSLDVWNLFSGGEFLKGALYLILSIILSIGALGLGVYIAGKL